MSVFMLDGETLSCEKLAGIARGRAKISLSEKARQRINASRAVVERMFRNKEPAYGTTTGIGSLASVLLSEEQAREFSKNLVYSHSAGYGEPVPEGVSRAAIASRVNVLAKGMSGVRIEVVEKIIEVLNKQVTPVMYPASVGACGDLAPLAQAMLVPLGEGEAFFEGKRMPGGEALKKAGVEPITYEIRDGLAVINGSNLIAGMGALEVVDADVLVKSSEITAAVTFEALKAVTVAFDERILKARGFPGGVECAENIRRIFAGSEILGKQERVQDAYSIRSTPQVVGAAKDVLKWARAQIEIELNGGADNPLFVPDLNSKQEGAGAYLCGANFQGTPMAFALELVGIAVTTLSVIGERRINRLTNPALNVGLPGFLIEGAGAYTGIMIPQYTAASLVCENRVLCTPACTGSIPCAADQEDFVSMGTNTALKTRRIIDNAFAVVAIELLAACQALDLRMKMDGKKPGDGTRAAYEVVRKYVNFLDKDRPLYLDIEKLAQVLKSGEVLEAVEKQVGKLK